MTYLICSDVDGTLMVDHTQMTPATRQAIRQIMAQGNQFYIASGRMLPLARQTAALIGGPVKIIAADGATFEQGDQLVTSHLANAKLKLIYQTALSNNCRVFFFETNRIYYTGCEPPYQTKAAHAHTGGLPNDLNVMPLIGPEFLPNLGDHITNAIVYGQPSELALVRQILVDQTMLSLTSTPDHLEIVPHGVDKAFALASIQRHLGIDRAHTIVFGDALEDISTFRLAGHSVAMGNANEALKQVATDVTLSNDQDGVAVFLQDFFNLNENIAHG